MTEYDLSLEGNPVMGRADAPIDVLYWSDYLCPFCRKFALEVHPELARNEVKRGDARFIFLELPNIAKNSWPAAMIAKSVWRQVAADDPNAYWKWDRTVFERQEKPDSGWADRENLLSITRDVGIDADAVAAILDEQYQSIDREVQNEIAAANRERIPGTPAFVLYNRESGQSKTIVGAQPYERYSDTIASLMN